MRRCALIALAALIALVIFAGWAFPKDAPRLRKSRVPDVITKPHHDKGLAAARHETLWVFDADFEVLAGDNLGWTTHDLSGTIGQTNYWHHDTIRLDTFPWLGDSTWWCGTAYPCLRHARGYGNNWWCQILERRMSEMAGTSPGDLVELEYDQRFAMESGYDFGHVEVSDDGGASWLTLATITNDPGPAGGIPCDWGGPGSHVVLPLSSYAGQAIDLRYRFTSDAMFSSEDSGSPAVRDGAWQLDNITLKRNGTPIFYDDAESGNLGWVHDDCPPRSQTGVVFWRGQYGIDFDTGRPFTCYSRPIGSWMYAAVDMFSSTMVTGEYTVLLSPAIDITGGAHIVGEWDMWVDLPEPKNDIYDLYLASHDIEECVTAWPGSFVDEDPGWWYGGAFFRTWQDDWSHAAGNDWLGVAWLLRNYEEPYLNHMAGIFLNRQRVGLVVGDAGTSFQRDIWNSFNDWFPCDMVEAFTDTARIRVTDPDDVVAVLLLASNNDGQTWSAYPCIQESGDGDWWRTPPPLNEIVPGSEIHYYWEATDGFGNTCVYPETAPRRCFEMSILPITGSTVDPTILLVDKHGRRTPGAEFDWGFYDPMGRYKCYSEYYFREALEILGYRWDTYDVEVPSGNIKSDGPDTCGMKYYDTQIWFSSNYDAFTFSPMDQLNLVLWLNQAYEGKERNLFVTGNDIGYELIGINRETLCFYHIWLASDYLANEVGPATIDSVPGVEDYDAPGDDFEFLGTDPDQGLDGRFALQGGCPLLNYFDVVDARPGVVGVERVANYCKMDNTRLPAGVAYTEVSSGYQTVNLGFGFDFIRDGGCYDDRKGYYNYWGHHLVGTLDRVALMDSILTYFGLSPDATGTGVVEDRPGNALSQAAPNPFNPATKIAFSVKEAGPVRIEVYNVAGRIVRTLLDTELAAGTDGYVMWNGTDDRGEQCASGVYFYRIEAPGFVASRKMVMLR